MGRAQRRKASSDGIDPKREKRYRFPIRAGSSIFAVADPCVVLLSLNAVRYSAKCGQLAPTLAKKKVSCSPQESISSGPRRAGVLDSCSRLAY
jgi:hypothetical protein